MTTSIKTCDTTK